MDRQKQDRDQGKTNGTNLGNQISITKYNEQSNTTRNGNDYDNDERNESNVAAALETPISSRNNNNNNNDNSGDISKRQIVDLDRQTLNQFGSGKSKYHCHGN